jgi:tetratricopeptide (TPR) repeat protein
MRTFPDLRIRDAVWESQRAGRLLDDREWAAAREAFTALRARTAKLGLRSSYLAWGLAVALDNLGEIEMAFEAASEGVKVDPMNPACQHSFDVIANRLRAALADPERTPEDESTPRLYALLQDAGEADVPSHLAMASHLAHAGKKAEAMALLDAVTLLSPISRDAWLHKASLARALGDATLAATCEAQAAAIAASDAPFGIPAPRGVAC